MEENTLSKVRNLDLSSSIKGQLAFILYASAKLFLGMHAFSYFLFFDRPYWPYLARGQPRRQGKKLMPKTRQIKHPLLGALQTKACMFRRCGKNTMYAKIIEAKGVDEGPVAPSVFKTVERCFASLVGSTPMHSRHFAGGALKVWPSFSFLFIQGVKVRLDSA